MEKLGDLLEKVVKYNLFDLVQLEKLGDDCYKHKNIVFDQTYHHTPEIYIFADNNLDIMKDRKNFFKKDLCLNVYGTKDVSWTYDESPKYESYWFVRGKWVDYIENYLKQMDDIVNTKEKELNDIKLKAKKVKKIKQEQEEQERVKKFEKSFNDTELNMI